MLNGKYAVAKRLVDLLVELPYCRMQNLVDKGIAGRQAASRYLKHLVDMGVLQERAIGREKLFIHPRLLTRLTRDDHTIAAFGADQAA